MQPPGDTGPIIMTTTNDQAIEAEIQSKGLTAPRVTPERIAELMSRIVYTFDVRPNGSTTTLAHAFLDGQFYLATGVSACVSVANFDAELGMRIATDNAKAAAEDKLWELEGYALRERLAASISTAGAMAALKAAINADPEYAWSWHCAIWSGAHDEGLETGAANRAAARVMRMAFDCDTSKNANFSAALPVPAPDLRPAADAQGQ